jgi:DNA helicase-2/ATP-dependent DNA helicase PcrA
MSQLEIPFQRFNPNAIRSRISNAKNRLITPEQFAAQAAELFDEKAALVFRQYEKLLKHNNAMDFDDLLLKPIDVFMRSKQTLEKYQDKFRFILVDEYQDTNKAQYTLIKLLAAKYRNLCVVGDDAQSIYAFRGADINNILDFEKDFPEAKVFRLEQNYRSTKTILAAADGVIKQNRNQIKKTLWTENGTGESITLVYCSDDKDEGAQIVARIEEDSRRFKLNLKHFAVLYRTNAQSRSIEDALRRVNLPYEIIGGTEFYDRKEIKDLLAYLRVLSNPADDESFHRIVNFPARGLGDVSIGKLEEFAAAEQLSLLGACGVAERILTLPERLRSAFLGLAAFFAKYRTMRGQVSLSELTRTLVDELGILTKLKEEGTVESMGRWENIQELLSAISEEVSKDETTTLESFLEGVALVSDVDKWEDKANSVTLMTLHAAKGLEFPVVFLTGMEEGLFPLYNGQLEQQALEEERRLCYVGMTRAKLKLYLTYTRSRFRFGDITYPTPSRFIGEIGSEYLESTMSFASESSAITRSSTTRRPSAPERTSMFADTTPDYENESQEQIELSVGMIVYHELFGKGKILGLSGVGENTRALVDFVSIGKKQLALKYARLRIEE